MKFNKLENNVQFFVNNTEDFEDVPMTGTKGFVPWELYDTAPTPVTDAEMRALSFDKRSSVRTKHSERFKWIPRSCNLEACSKRRYQCENAGYAYNWC